jgi:nitrite reductase/ring-hydroxylating ferredoxin subunit
VNNPAFDYGLEQRWFPLCGPQDLPAHHVYETALLGQELAVWRGTSGVINVWENRCPHRGMRLTMGANLGTELRCAYHGYRFADGSGRCTAVPAHPGNAPPAAMGARTFPFVQHLGLIWTSLGTLPWREPAVGDAQAIPLYGVAVNAAAARVAHYLPRYQFRPSFALGDSDQSNERCATRGIDAFSFESAAASRGRSEAVLLYLQPLDAGSSRIHARLVAPLAPERRLAVLQHHAAQLSALRAMIESEPPG